MLLDLLRTVNAQTLRRVAVQKTREDGLRGRRDLRPEDERIVEDLLVHGVGVLCGRVSTTLMDGLTRNAPS